MVEEEGGFNGFGMCCVDSGSELKSILLMVDFPDFDDTLGVASDRIFDTASTSDKITLQSEDFSVAVKAGMLFIGYENVFIDQVVIIEIPCSI